MAARKKHWSKCIEHEGQRIRIYERHGSSSLWYSVVQSGKKIRRSLGTGDRALAESRAKAIALELARARLTGENPPTITLGQVFSFYFQLQGPRTLGRLEEDRPDAAKPLLRSAGAWIRWPWILARLMWTVTDGCGAAHSAQTGEAGDIAVYEKGP